jgi:hypothetical protein
MAASGYRQNGPVTFTNCHVRQNVAIDFNFEITTIDPRRLQSGAGDDSALAWDSNPAHKTGRKNCGLRFLRDQPARLADTALGKRSMREDYYLDGIKYVVSSTEYATGFYGSWICDECGQAGMHGLPLKTEADAILYAKLSAIEHQQANHEDASASPTGD